MLSASSWVRFLLSHFLLVVWVLVWVWLTRSEYGWTFLPGWIIVLHVCGGGCLAIAWVRLRGTALRPALAWGFVSISASGAATLVNMNEMFMANNALSATGLFWAGLCLIAGLISVFNARSPGAGAWAWLLFVLVLVFQIPRLEAGGMNVWSLMNERPRLEGLWSVFFGVLAVAGCLNLVPTRRVLAAMCALLCLVLQLSALVSNNPHVQGLCDHLLRAFYPLPWILATLAAMQPLPEARSLPVDRLWFWFRDLWGVVWGMRVIDRFNREAQLGGWPFRLSWGGLVSAKGELPAANSEPAENALGVLKGLLRRFATPARLADVAGEEVAPSARNSAPGA